MNVNLKAATKTFSMLAPSRLLPIANLTGEGVKSFVNAEKSLIESMIKPRNGKVVNMGERRKRPTHHKAEKVHMAHTGS